MWIFLKSWGALIVAFLALIQPWLLASWRRYILKGNIDVHSLPFIELSYTGLGPTIAIYGTFRAIAKDQFINKIDVKITNKKTKEEHLFDWLVFRQTQLQAANVPQLTPNVSIDQARSFAVKTSDPKNYEIVLSELSLKDEIQTLLMSIKQQWTHFLIEKLRNLGDLPSQIKTKEDLSLLISQHGILEEFTSQQTIFDTYSKIDKKNYWQSGDYILDIRIYRPSSNMPIRKRWTFVLTDAEVEMLSGNAAAAIREICEQNYLYQFLYPRLTEQD